MRTTVLAVAVVLLLSGMFALALFSINANTPDGSEIAQTATVGELQQQLLTAQIVPCSGPNCDFCALGKLGTNVIAFFVSLAVIVAVGLFVFAGFLLLSSGGDPEKISQAKRIFINVLIGLVIVLVSWLVIDTLLKALLSPGFTGKVGPWNQILCSKRGPSEKLDTSLINSPVGTTRTCFRTGAGQQKCFTSASACRTAQGDAGINAENPSQCQVFTVSTTGSGGRTVIKAGVDKRTENEKAEDESKMRKRLAMLGIQVNKGACGVNQSYKAKSGGCTDVSGLTQSTIEEAARWARECKCKVLITGGNELGHQTHDDGRRLDLPLNDGVGAWAQKQVANKSFRFTGTGKLGRIYCDSGGNRWLKENNHWHVGVGLCKGT